MTELDRRLEQGKAARQRFEMAQRVALGSKRVGDYEIALSEAVMAMQVLDGIIAAHVRIVLTDSVPA